MNSDKGRRSSFNDARRIDPTRPFNYTMNSPDPFLARTSSFPLLDHHPQTGVSKADSTGHLRSFSRPRPPRDMSNSRRLYSTSDLTKRALQEASSRYKPREDDVFETLTFPSPAPSAAVSKLDPQEDWGAIDSSSRRRRIEIARGKLEEFFKNRRWNESERKQQPQQQQQDPEHMQVSRRESQASNESSLHQTSTHKSYLSRSLNDFYLGDAWSTDDYPKDRPPPAPPQKSAAPPTHVPAENIFVKVTPPTPTSSSIVSSSQQTAQQQEETDSSLAHQHDSRRSSRTSVKSDDSRRTSEWAIGGSQMTSETDTPTDMAKSPRKRAPLPPPLVAPKPRHLLLTRQNSLQAHAEETDQVSSSYMVSNSLQAHAEETDQVSPPGTVSSCRTSPVEDNESGIFLHAPSTWGAISDNDSAAKEEQAEGKEETDGLWRPYDSFGLSEREVDDDKIFREILKFVRCGLYLFIVLALLALTVAGRIAIFVLASDINKSEEARSQSVVHLILCLCAPMLYNWFKIAMKIHFGSKEWPSKGTFITVLIMELMSTAGMCLLVFRILPSTDIFRGITITFALFLIPGFLEMAFMDRLKACTAKATAKTIVTILACATQLGGPAYFILLSFCNGERYHKILTRPDSSQQTPVDDQNLLEGLKWEIPVALVLISLAWWENFVSKDLTLCPGIRLPISNWRQVLQETRDTCSLLTTPFKMGLVVTLGRFLTNANFEKFSWHDSAEERGWDAFEHYTLLTIILGSAILCTYLGGLACKLQMQRIAFAIPLLLSPPASLAVVYLQCRYEFLSVKWHTGAWYCPNLELDDLYQPIAVAAALWISYCIITSYVWFPKVERMAKSEKLFLTPHFTSLFPDFNLTMRRRRDDRELRLNSLGTYVYVVKDKIINGSSSESSANTTTDTNKTTPTIFVCATMWHETKLEMTQLLKSLFRLDYSHCASRMAQARFNISDPDYFNMEIHIIFDDAFELHEKKNKYVLNSFVRQFMNSMEEAASSVVKGSIAIPSPIKVATPYGGRLVWTMPGQTQLVVHLKNKNKIRHRKRWSQVMYMYYLLGYRLLGGANGSDFKEEDRPSQPQNLRNRKKYDMEQRLRKNLPFKQLLQHVPRGHYEEIVEMAENTFILTLDGDIDFKPDTVKLLLDKMRKNKKVGAACGRIHPIGSGPMVWYQQFEYAVSHWLQKAAENVFGCVLCCPGCFSLFRGSALMDDNVLKMYTTKPTEARHYIQFEQGEDRWLCTLLLQQGHRIDYSAGADAHTFAPESFSEFFNQRRRWSPSTLANIMDVIASWRSTIRINHNINRLFVLYQFVLVTAGILAPSTVLLMITDSFKTVLHFSTWWAYCLATSPVVFYTAICLTQKTSIQIKVGAVLSACYTVVMMIASVGAIIRIFSESYYSPNTVFVSFLFAVFFITALFHPQEMHNLVLGVVYFLVIPTTFVLLTVFYLCNLNNVSWGTREGIQKLTPEEQAEMEREKKRKKNSWNLCSSRGLKNIIGEIRELIIAVWGLRKELEQQKAGERPFDVSSTASNVDMIEKADDVSFLAISASFKPEREDPSIELDPDRPYWLQESTSGEGPEEVLSDSEAEFWKYLIKKYLYPLDLNRGQKAKIAQDLKETRNSVVFLYTLLNFLWTVISLMIQASENDLKEFYIGRQHEPLSNVLLATYALLVLIQFTGMFIHRWGTFLHLMSSTNIDWFFGTHSDEEFARFVVREIQKHQNLEPPPDYENSEDGDSEDMYGAEQAEEREDHTRDDNLYPRSGYRSQYDRPVQVGPRGWGALPTTPGHFPRLENILDDNLDRLRRLRRRMDRQAAATSQAGANRRGSFLGSLRGFYKSDSRNMGAAAGQQNGQQRWTSGGAAAMQHYNQHHPRNRGLSGWSAKNLSMRNRFLQHNVFTGRAGQQGPSSPSARDVFRGVQVV